LAAERYDHVVLSDISPIYDLSPHETFVQLDVSDAQATLAEIRGVNGIVHLAGLVGPDFRFREVLEPNIVGTYHVLEAARANGISQVVVASSHHAVGFYGRADRIDHLAAPRPDSFYGVSKACGEALARYYADKHGLNVLTIRIGFVGKQAIDERRVHTWISPRDLAQLIDIGLNRPDLGYELVYGVSRNPGPFFDNTNAQRLGYRPQDCAEDHVVDPALLSESVNPDLPEQRCVGGHFVTRRAELDS
jgi:uronate dehydrogenase